MAQSYQVDIVTKVVGASKIAQLDKALDQLAKNEQKVDTAARKAASSTNTLGSSAQTAGTKAKASAAGFKSMGAAINAAAAKITIIIGAVQTFSQVMGAAFERQNAEQRLKNLTGSTAEYEAALLSAAAVSQKFGISQTQATQALGDVYSRLSGVGFGLKEVTTIYEGFNTVARQSGISSEAASSAFLQLGQALGSGVLQGDEMRSILEQMPQLTQMIAREMGIAASQVKQFGSEGKVTSDIIYSALQKAAEGATDLDGKLTPTQQSMNDFNKALDNASVALGTTLVPALTSLIQAITPVIEAVGQLTEKLNELGLSKVFEFLMTPARLFGELVNDAAVNTEDLSGKAAQAVESFSGLPDPIESAKEKTEQLKEQTQQLANAQHEYQAALGSDQGDIGRKLQVTQALLDAEKQINDAKLQQANADLESASSLSQKESAIQRIYETTVANARLEYEATIASAEAEQQKVEAALRHAEVLAQQIKAEISLQQAKGVYNDSQQKALANASKLVQEAQKNLDAQTQISQAIMTGAKATLQKQLESAKVTMQMQQQTAQQYQTNSAIQQGAAAMSQLANEAQRASAAAASIGSGASSWANMGKSGSLVHQKGHTPIGMYKAVDGNLVQKTEQEIEQEYLSIALSGRGGKKIVYDNSKMSGAFAAQLDNWSTIPSGQSGHKMINPWDIQAGVHYNTFFGPQYMDNQEIWNTMGQPNAGILRHYADGGYVTAPQQAVVGEGGEPEYIIPSSKMGAAMDRYGAGMRGSSVIPDSATVSVNYNGSTVDMAGQSYINRGDVNGIVTKAVNQTLNTLKKSPRARLEAGIK